jgi:hypothetical protein
MSVTLTGTLSENHSRDSLHHSTSVGSSSKTTAAVSSGESWQSVVACAVRMDLANHGFILARKQA